MRVLVTAIAQPEGISGVQRHALNLVRCLLSTPEITRVHLALAPWQQNLPSLAGLQSSDRLAIELIPMERNPWARNLWHLRSLPALARSLEVDLVHLSYPVPFTRSSMPCPVVMTLHDLYPFEIPGNFGFPQVFFNRWILRFALRQATAIACVSRTTQSALERFNLAPNTSLCVTIPNCVENSSTVSLRCPIYGWNGEPFLLAVAQHRRNKNLDLLLRSFARLVAVGVCAPDCTLVIVGMRGPETPKLHALARDLGISSRVDFLAGLADEELQWCYKHCAALVAPSSTEGFGLPIAEARMAGCRIVCSNIAAFTDLAGPQVHLVDLQGDAEIKLCAAIQDALSSPRPAPEPMPELAIEPIANSYLHLYQTLLNRSTPRSENRINPQPSKRQLP